MKRFITTICASLLFFVFFTSANAQFLRLGKDPVVAKVGTEKITLSELKRFYERNNPQSEATSEELSEFLNAYSIYRAKLVEASELGFTNDDTFLKEVDDFDKKAAPAYWIEKELKEQLLQEFIERSKTEYLVSHVLIRLDENASPSDTLDAYKSLINARDEFFSGISMDSLNIKYSSRVRATPVGGKIPWFSAGTTVYDFENVVYSLEPGELSMPVRTQFGYHIVLVEAKRPRTPGFFVSHIFFREGDQSQVRIDSALLSLSNGVEWNDVVTQYSDDRQSAFNGGSIGLVGHNLRFPDEFSTTVLQLDTESPWSEPVTTLYGTHIFRVDSVENLELTDQRLLQLEQQLRQLPRYKLDDQDVVDQILKSGYVTISWKGTEDAMLLKSEVATDSIQIDWTLIQSSETLNPESIMLTVIDKRVRLDDFINWIKENHPDLTPDDITENLSTDFFKSIIMESVGDITAQLYPDYAETRVQFYNGLLVFKLNEKYIWDPSSADSARVRDYFDQNVAIYEEAARDKSETDSLSVLSADRINRDELFENVFFRVFSDMQSVLEEEYHQYLTQKYRIRHYPKRIR